ncbi:hypothetical protein QTP86_007248 [Hemibagrus guttatus]|nr:hypothetical protein QTP86_007248 [Hemibagrus guttatus]
MPSVPLTYRAPVEIGLLFVEEVEEGGECVDRERRGTCVDSKRNGIGVVLKEEFVRNVLEVKRVSDRVMSLKLEIEGVMLNVVSGYAPQVGCDEEGMGKFGVKESNLERQMVVDFAKRMDMAVVNTYFQKREEHRVTYKSGDKDSFELHSVDLDLEVMEKQICDLQVKQAQLRQQKAVLESSRTDAHLSQAQRTKDAARPDFVHSGAGVTRSLDAAAAEDASQAPGKDLSPSAATHLRDLGVRRGTGTILKKNIGAVVLHAGTNNIRLRQAEILKKDFRSLV